MSHKPNGLVQLSVIGSPPISTIYIQLTLNQFMVSVGNLNKLWTAKLDSTPINYLVKVKLVQPVAIRPSPQCDVGMIKSVKICQLKTQINEPCVNTTTSRATIIQACIQNKIVVS